MSALSATPLPARRPVAVALAASVALHLMLAWSLGLDVFERDRMLQLQMERTKPEPVLFELVDTPESAEVQDAPKDSSFISNRNTRAQQTHPVERRQGDQPQVVARAEGHDLRPEATAPKIGVPVPPEPMALPTPESTPDVTPPMPTQEPAPESPAKNAEQHPVQRQESQVSVEMVKQPPMPTEPDREAEPEPVKVAMAPAKPAPPVTPLPKKDSTQNQRRVEELRREIAALKQSENVRGGRATLTAAEADALAGVEIEGELSYAATQYYFADYMLKMKNLVEAQWISQLVTSYTSARNSEAVIDFKVLANGKVSGVIVRSQEGDDYFPVVCIHAIKDAAPFDPVPYDAVSDIPGELKGRPLNIRFTFQYN